MDIVWSRDLVSILSSYARGGFNR